MPQRQLAPEALDWLAQQPWPGNIRELRNRLEQVSLMSDELQLSLHSFDPDARPRLPPPCASAAAVPAAQAPALGEIRPLSERVEALERDAIAQALAATGGNRMAAARLLQISRASLYERLTRWPDLASA
jgi:DNA-binding NtrC family response regulator